MPMDRFSSAPGGFTMTDPRNPLWGIGNLMATEQSRRDEETRRKEEREAELTQLTERQAPSISPEAWKRMREHNKGGGFLGIPGFVSKLFGGDGGKDPRAGTAPAGYESYGGPGAGGAAAPTTLPPVAPARPSPFPRTSVGWAPGGGGGPGGGVGPGTDESGGGGGILRGIGGFLGENPEVITGLAGTAASVYGAHKTRQQQQKDREQAAAEFDRAQSERERRNQAEEDAARKRREAENMRMILSAMSSFS